MTPDEQIDLEIAALLDAMKDMELQIQKLLQWERTVKKLVGITCPVCQADEAINTHHPATFGFPECRYWRCGNCLHEWGHR